MEIQRVIPAIRSSIPSSLTTPATKPDGGANFGQMLKDAFADIIQTDMQDKASTISAITGGNTDLHNATIAAQKAEIALSLTLAVRNKMIEAYQEVMRMQV